MSNSQKKAIVFPLNRSKAKDVSIDELKERNPGNVSGFLVKESRGYEWDESIRDALNKANRLTRAWQRLAGTYELCLFCFGPAISYKDETNFYFIHCKRCSDDIWNSKCLCCSIFLEARYYLFCLNCLELIDDKTLKAQFNAFVRDNNISEVERELRIVEPQRCSLCNEVVAPYLGIFCPKHEVLSRNYGRFSRQLNIENKCNFCEEQLPAKIKDAKSNSHLCQTCLDDWQRSLDTCFSCGRDMSRFFNGVEMNVRFEICMDCVVGRSEIAANWKTSESSGERALFRILCQLFGKNDIYRYLRPSWLSGLELDFYVPSRNLAFEFDGKQHYEYVSRFHESKESFESQRKRDAKKDELCKKNSVRLIRIKYDFELSKERIQMLIASEEHLKI